jgi:hypothetical protein
MKRVLLALVMALFVLSSAVGCGGSSPTPSGTKPK